MAKILFVKEHPDCFVIGAVSRRKTPEDRIEGFYLAAGTLFGWLFDRL